MNTKRSSHHVLRNERVSEHRVLDSKSLHAFDEFVMFVRTHHNDLNCKRPPCMVQDDLVHSLSFLLVRTGKERSDILQELFWYLRSDKNNVIQSDIQHKAGVGDELDFTPYLAVELVASDILKEHPDFENYIQEAIEPLRTFVDILQVLRQQ